MPEPRTLKELIIEAIDAGCSITTPLHDGAIKGAKVAKKPVLHTELTLGVPSNLLSVPALFAWINGGEVPPYVPYIVWVPRDVEQRTKAKRESEEQGRQPT